MIVPGDIASCPYITQNSLTAQAKHVEAMYVTQALAT